MNHSLSYAVITPARNEAGYLPKLAGCLAEQTLLPSAWVIVDDGSEDGTSDVAAALAAAHDWIVVEGHHGESTPTRGGPVVRAFTAGVARLEDVPDVVVKLDADVTFDSDFFARLLAVLASEPRLGIASGICCELRRGKWRPLYGTRSHVWGAVRAYRRECLEEISPLEERQGWDEIDALKAHVRGWTARTLFDLPFRHHRLEGERDGQIRRWADQGETARYMGYRPTYLSLRVLYRMVREPWALGMVWGYGVAALRRAPKLDDAAVRRHLRDQQRLRTLPSRAREALGLTAHSA